MHIGAWLRGAKSAANGHPYRGPYEAIPFAGFLPHAFSSGGTVPKKGGENCCGIAIFGRLVRDGSVA